jgi:hypothetical protein
MKMAAKVLFLSLSLGGLTTATFAQAGDKKPERPRDRQPDGEVQRRERGPAGEGRGMGQLSKEKLEAAWNAQATAAAKRLSLSSEQTAAVAKAYVETRETVRAKMEEARKNASEDNADSGRKSVREAEAAAKEKFAKALTDAKVSSENTTKLTASLGSGLLTGPMWDRMTDTVLGMKLEAAKQQTAQNALEDFVVANTQAMGAGRDNPEGARESRQKAREDLTTALKGVLTAEQLKTFEESMPRGAGMRRGPEGGRPEGGRPEGKPDGEKTDGGKGKDRPKK